MQSDDSNVVARGSVFGVILRCDDEPRRGSRGRNERWSKFEWIAQVRAEFGARPDARIDGFVSDDRERRADRKRRHRRGGLRPRGGVRLGVRSNEDRCDEGNGDACNYDTFFSSAAAASAAARFPCSINAFTF